MATAVPDEIIKTLMLKEHPTADEFFELCPDSGTKTRCQLEVVDLDEVPGLNVYETDTVDEKEVEVFIVKGTKCNKLIYVGMMSACPAEDSLEWDYGTSANTIAAPESDAVVAVTGGIGPFEWTISGIGVTLDSASTSGRTNTIDADETACGAIEIVVTDVCDDSTTGYVRAPGSWTEIEAAEHKVVGEPACPETFYNPGSGSGTGTFESIIGKYRVVETVGGFTDQFAGGACPSHGTCLGRYLADARFPCICDLDVWGARTCSPDVGTVTLPGTWPCCHTEVPDVHFCRGQTVRSLYEWGGCP